MIDPADNKPSYPVFHPRNGTPPPGRLSPTAFARSFPGESHFVEFKQGISESRIAEAVTSFSNADGGVVLLGVGPDGTPVGLEADSELRAKIHRLIAKVHNPGRYGLVPVTVGDHHILVLAVDHRQDGFAQAPDGRVLQRREAQNVTLVGAELQHLLSQRALTRFESHPTRSALNDASPALLQSLADAWGWREEAAIPERLVEKGLAVREAHGTVLTVAGSLYLREDPAADQRKYHIELFRYADDSDRYDRRLRIGGPLPEQVRRATRTIQDELGTEMVVVGTQRYELPRVPTKVLREAVANAVAHRVYEDQRRPVKVELRPGRVVVTSPGPLPEPVTVSNIREQNAPRNIAVIDSLRRFGLAEDAGRGVDVMEDVMQAYLLARPEFTDDGTAVTVTLSTTSTVAPEERAWLLALERDGSFSHEERQLVMLTAREGNLTNSRARAALAIDSVAARRLLTRLRDRGILTQHGDRGGAQYALSRELLPPDAQIFSATDPADLKATIVDLARTGVVTNERVREATGLDRAAALRELNGLVEADTLVRHGDRRGATYTLAGDA